MDVREFRVQFNEEIEIAAKAHLSNPQDEFLYKTISIMQDAEEFDDFTECYYEGKSSLKSEQRIDGYSFDETDGICSVVITDYRGSFGAETISSDSIIKSFDKVFSFIGDAIREPFFENLEESTEAFEFAKLLFTKQDDILGFRFYLITDAFKEHNDIKLRNKDVFGKKVVFEIWDIPRIYNVISSVNQKDSVEITVSDYGIKGIPCVQAVNCKNVIADIESDTQNQKNDDNKITYKSYLAVVPGQLLHNLYNTYGNKLLEGNVRSFLSSKGKVNSSIQRTIIHYPDMFFAYNNGIAATASAIDTEKSEEGLIITKIKDLQIVNGGQTTASITNTVLHAREDEKVDLSKLYIPMKVSVLDPKMSEKIIPKISEYSNSQNKVEASDFFSNHPFHKRMEKFSQEISAPIINGNQFHQYWFYERMRGQYLQGMMKYKAKSSELLQYQQKFPKSQVIKMVELAKYMEIFNGKPHIVSKGKQALFKDFSANIKSSWEKNDTQYNAFYYKRLVCIAIMFNELDEIVKNTSWYQIKHSYKANIVAYTLSLIFEYIRKNYPKKSIDFNKIWDKQTMYEELIKEATVLSKEVYDYITRDDRPKENVTEWCKDERCWNNALEEIWTFSKGFINSLIDTASFEEDAAEAKKTQKVANEVDAMTFVMTAGADYWKKLYKWATERNMLTDMEESIIQVVIKSFVTGKLASEKQLKVVMTARERLLKNGMPITFY